jgi:hypothetical protein
MAHLQRNAADDLLFPQNESGQTRFNKMRVILFSGSGAAKRTAEFVRTYTNRDGSTGLPPAHIGATSPYIDGGNLFYLFFQDNANDPFVLANFGGDPTDLVALNAAEATRALAVTANGTLLAKLQGSDTGWRN